MPTFIAIVGAIIAFFIVVLVHELGHFIVARMTGVKVLRFSIGFGKPIWSYRAKSGIDYVIGILPLGGYVKMQDVSSAETQDAPQGSNGMVFERKSVWARMAVVVAGPIANFLLAIFLFTIVYLVGVTQIKPIVGEVIPHSVAANGNIQPGDQILRVGQWETHSWQQVLMALIGHIGDQKPLPMTVLPSHSAQSVNRYLNLQEWRINPMRPELLQGLGLMPYFPPIPPVIAVIMPGSPASKSGLRVNDLLLSANNKPIPSWQSWVDWVGRHPDQSVKLVIKRDGMVKTLDVIISHRKENGRVVGYLGLIPHSVQIPTALEMKEQRFGLDAPRSAVILTARWVAFHLLVLKQILLGKISLKTLSGPVSIFQAAGTASLGGTIAFLQFVAFISVVLGVFNLLPIPALDGGHLLFCVIEGIQGKAIPLKIQTLLTNAGVVLLLMIMFYATMNDVIRLLQ